MIGDMLTDWPVGTVLGIVLIVCILILVGIVLSSLFVAIDSWFLPRSRKAGRVVEKEFTPAYTQTTMIYNETTKTSMPYIIYHSDSWSVNVELDGQHDRVSVSKEFFDSLSANDSVLAEYVIGRLSRSLYIKALFPI